MAEEEKQDEQDNQLEEWTPRPGDITIRQVPLAWLMSSTPWLIVTAVLLALPALGIAFGIEEWVAAVLIIIVIVPRYFMWRGTAYTISEDHLVYQRGGIMSSKAYPLPYARMTDVRARYGMFGRALGYQAVDVMMDNGAVAPLSYVPIVTDAADRIRAKIIERGGSVATEPDKPDDADC